MSIAGVRRFTDADIIRMLQEGDLLGFLEILPIDNGDGAYVAGSGPRRILMFAAVTPNVPHEMKELAINILAGSVNIFTFYQNVTVLLKGYAGKAKVGNYLKSLIHDDRVDEEMCEIIGGLDEAEIFALMQYLDEKYRKKGVKMGLSKLIVLRCHELKMLGVQEMLIIMSHSMMEMPDISSRAELGEIMEALYKQMME